MEVTDYLMDLQRSQIYHLGLVLGLSPRRVVDLRDSRASNLEFLDAVVLHWIQRLDHVEEVSWSALVRALHHPRLGQTGIANTIATKYGTYSDMYMYNLHIHIHARTYTCVSINCQCLLSSHYHWILGLTFIHYCLLQLHTCISH